jgi:hypothetical protein
MTIGIGALATGTKFKPDTIVLSSDTLGSYGDAYSTAKLHKMYVMPKDRLYVVACDEIERASELVPMMQQNIQKLQYRNHGPIYDALHRAVHTYYNQRATYEVLPKFMLTPEQFRTERIEDALRDRIIAEWMSFYSGCQLIVGTFADSGQALLYTIDGRANRQDDKSPPTVELVRSVSIPGFAAIGSGAGNAEFWLAYRDYTLSCSPRRAVYHTYEARLMAEKSAHVNDNVELLIATKDEHFRLTKQRPQSGEWSLGELSELFKKYGPQSTEPLGIPRGASKERDALFD